MAFRIALACLIAVTLACEAGAESPDSATSQLTDKDFILEVTETGQWKPTEAQVATAKTALIAYLSSDARPTTSSAEKYFEGMRPSIKARIGSYSLQYFGGFYNWQDHGWDPAGDKEILINALCDSFVKNEHVNLTKSLEHVDDGGACFFQAAYSLAQRKIVHFSVNGMA